jgi:NAD(P)-dependent dehydrogenase (short-subunit alcohol dehydrogenase family)
MKYKNLFSCKGKVAVVTGGSGLLGREMAAALLEQGATVYNADIAGLSSRKKIRNLRLDICDEKSIVEAFSKINKEAKQIDILVNSAYPRTPDWGKKMEDVPFGSWKANLNDHLGGYFLCCREAARYMKKQGGGSIINIGSIYGVIGPDFSLYEGTDMTSPAAYAAIKAGIIGFTRYLASYYGKYHVRANVISPGGVHDRQPKVFVDRYCRKTPLCRMAKPSDLAGAVVFLASDASSYVTGHNLMVDGGLTIC